MKKLLICLALAPLVLYAEDGGSFNQNTFSNDQFSTPQVEFSQGEWRDPINDPPASPTAPQTQRGFDDNYDVYDYDYYPEVYEQYDEGYNLDDTYQDGGEFESEYESDFQQQLRQEEQYDDYDYYDFNGKDPQSEPFEPMEPIEDF